MPEIVLKHLTWQEIDERIRALDAILVVTVETIIGHSTSALDSEDSTKNERVKL